ncbi:hypothetical protein Cme02nite_02290 [Catellatospora methionotrophica]|uniref:Uncharacterized protein n=1 Tax=Catellatospora methionotrophica TaxID=121620 RepID=A0A8J3PCD4_9ACTN|nr:hypothetical protein [Catellatospora methionotrophica]GIG11897.1 hypothetical protein Cme02nite_02290 [Catellatospora methionotrophica]
MSSPTDRHGTLHTPSLHGRVPDDLPVLLRSNPLAYALQLTQRRLFTVYLPLAAALCLIAIRSWLLTVIALAVVGLHYVVTCLDEATRARSPLLGADEHGLFLRPNGVARPALHLPWPYVKELAVRRSGGVWMLCVTPRDPGEDKRAQERETAGRFYGFWRIVRYQRMLRRLGTSLFIPIVGTDPDQLLTALTARRGAR